MKILYYDCFAGISGDMNLAAMIGLGVEPEYLRAELSKLGLDHEFELKVSADSKHGIHGVRVDVLLADQGEGHLPGQAHADGDSPQGHHHGHGHGHSHEPEASRPGHEYNHEHGHEHGHAHGHAAPCAGLGQAHESTGHSHHHAHAASGEGQAHDDAANAAGHEHGHGHAAPCACHAHAGGAPAGIACGRPHGHAPHRNLADVEAIINGSALAREVKATSLAIFRRVAEAEAKVHAKPLHEVHFHEVGATDSIVDIVGAAICFHRLGVDAVWASPVELGGGFVRCAHGLIPVPAPATVEILQGLPTTRGAVRHEATTPTGAAILAALADEFTAAPALVTEKTAYGVGHRDSDIPNVLRVHLARPAPARTAGAVHAARLLQCNIDDMTAEALGVAMDLLMENGAMDVHFTPIQMKKNRPATCLSLLCSAADEERFKELLFRHTSTLGLKSFPLEKTVLDITFERLETPLGPVTMKRAMRDGAVLRSKPELEDCRELARRHGMTLAEVYAAIAGCRK